MKKKKVYILRLSKVFLKGHPRAGELTNFRELYLEGKKIHTIRSGAYWEKVVKEVNAGNAVLSLRQWRDKPFASPMDPEFACLEKLGWQPFVKIGDAYQVPILAGSSNYLPLLIRDIAKNDGLSEDDFLSWFKYPKPFDGGIIHFTDFRY